MAERREKNPAARRERSEQTKRVHGVRGGVFEVRAMFVLLYICNCIYAQKLVSVCVQVCREAYKYNRLTLLETMYTALARR